MCSCSFVYTCWRLIASLVIVASAMFAHCITLQTLSQTTVSKVGCRASHLIILNHTPFKVHVYIYTTLMAQVFMCWGIVE